MAAAGTAGGEPADGVTGAAAPPLGVAGAAS